METPIALATQAPFTASSGTSIDSTYGSGASDKYWYGKLPAIVTSALLATLILAATAYGVFRPIDNWLQGARFTLLNRPPTGDVVFLEVDAASLQSVGVWPWPRTIHAAIIDRLLELNVKSVAFDIDFSATSTPENDSVFAKALKRAGGFAVLGAFEQPAGAGAGKIVNTPIAELADASDLVAVDVPLSEDNVVRDYPVSRVVGGRRIPSLAASLAGTNLQGIADGNGLFGINFAVDLAGIDRISAADLLAGKVSSERVRGRNIVIGASAQELRDFFVTPRFGLVPGGLVHVLAAETLSQGLAMHDLPWQLTAGAIAVLALLAGLLGQRLSGVRWLFGAATLAAIVELGAYWLQWQLALRVSSAPIHVALLTFVVAAIISDLRLRRKLHAQVTRQREFMRSMLGQVIADDFDGVVIINESGKILSHSRTALNFLADTAGNSAPALHPALAKLANDRFAIEADRCRQPTSGELAIAGKGGDLRYLEYVVTVSSIADKYAHRVACLTFRDVTERRSEQERLKFLASHDNSTGAWQRHWLIWNMQMQLDAASDSQAMILVLVELRRFGAVTNSLGDAVGERLLQAVFARLRAEGHQMIARIGDANFAIAVMDLPGRFAALQLCRTLIDQVGEPYMLGQRKITVGLDLGVAVSSSTSDRAEDLLAQARIAQAAARDGPVNCYQIFSPDMQAEFAEREWIESALRHALMQSQFTLHYQPQFDLASGECVGAEALIRWHHPERGLISPAKFITIAEESGLIIDIGRWALQTACQEAMNWPKRLSVAVNLSPLQFESPELLTDVRRALELSRLAPTRLTLEITESAVVTGGGENATLLDALRMHGVTVAIDDFGTGYSSLSYLYRIPFDKIKIDQSFIQQMLDDLGAAAIVESVLQLASKLGKTVVAEGIETAAQERLLKKMGCQGVQGYYFGRPMAAVDFRKICAEKFTDSCPVGRVA